MPASKPTIAQHYTSAIESLCHIVEAHFYGGRVEAALRVLGYGERTAAEPEVRPRDRAELLIRSGRMLTYWGSFATNQYDAPIGMLRQAEEIARELDEGPLLADALAELGRVFYQRTLAANMGSFDDAAAYFEQARTLREAAGDQRGLAESLFQEGLIAERRQRFDEALARFEQARALAERHSFRETLAEALRHLGFARLRADDLARARELYERAYASAKEMDFARGVAICETKLARP